MAVIGVGAENSIDEVTQYQMATMLAVTKQFGAFFLFLIMKDALL